MKTESFESLVIDRAFGELAPEVAELLEVHLARDPEAARRADRLAATIRRAGQAVAMSPQAVPSPAATGRLRLALAAQRRRALVWEWSRLAACLAAGLALGWMGHAGRHVTPAAFRPPMPAALRVASVPAPAGAGNDFWSLAKLEAAQSRRQSGADDAAERHRLRWESPVKMPFLEDNL